MLDHRQAGIVPKVNAFRPFSFLRRLGERISGGPVWRGGADDIVATLYEDGAILAISPSAAEIIGAAGNLVGRSLFDFVARDDRAGLRAALDHAADRGAYADPARLTVDFSLLRVRRAAAPAEIALRPLGRGRLAALIRQRPRLQTAPSLDTAPAETTLDEEETEVATNPAAVEDRIGDLAHEFKTPLNAIIGFADAMRSETYGPLGSDILGARKYAEYVNHIHASGVHLSSLVSAAQDYAKTRAGHYELALAPTNPAALVEDCVAMIHGQVEAAGLALRVNMDDALPEAMLDTRAIKQILVNLLSNAVKFTDAGEISVSARAKDGELEFVVKDTGVGMNQVVLAKLGGRYSDTHRKGVRGAGGSGLGLSLAFELARLHGGRLAFESAPGVGTTARLTVPVAEKAAGVSSRRAADIKSQLDRVNAFRAERARAANAA